MKTALTATVAQRFPLCVSHFSQCFLFPERRCHAYPFLPVNLDKGARYTTQSRNCKRKAKYLRSATVNQGLMGDDHQHFAFTQRE
ncbi:hypothetical protein G5S52_13855 [Grimontia sp. S25]|uniref:Uncharacterized protein n=1 Tax=Grimontia sedimenti TaxID=2711294 RepID=A0A6M1RMH2_9GAMM|nr:hypothetical protein [Grimontia sedimenti]NGN98689.1 hypothetical protein [Grimontia sedimenti]